ncbi:hypothetical protein FDP41_009098 [Naegleria fowleri]|uniref:Uncharacterized protein n=1 Tax=Naegleria fowleri TaxID=5763 RepID=A0A6A5BII1_NAEFO|nr:uncharacterized protein FDP41_009098 [Naegleria fowleri]KAF0972849.1 hypothetical protein FDP41_009098 [Naegleria fowleri]
MQGTLSVRDRCGEPALCSNLPNRDHVATSSHPRDQANYNLNDAIIVSILERDRYLYDEYYYYCHARANAPEEYYYRPLRRKHNADQHPLYVLDIISIIWSYIPEQYWLPSLVNLMLSCKSIARACLSKEAIASLWMRSPGFHVNSEGLMTFMLRDLLEICKMYRNDCATIFKKKLTISRILKLCTKGLSLTEKFENVTLHKMFISQKSLIELLGMQSRIKFLSFEGCKTLQDVEKPVVLKTQHLTGLSFLNSEIFFPNSTTFPKTLQSLEFFNTLSESDQGITNKIWSQLKTLKLWSDTDFLHKCSFQRVPLTHLIVPGLQCNIPDCVVGLTLVSLTYRQLHKKADSIKQNMSPFKQLKSLEIRKLKISRNIPLTKLFELLFVVFPNLKYLTLPESIIYNTKANLEQKKSNDDEEENDVIETYNNTLNSTTFTPFKNPFASDSLVQVKILHSSNAWKFFLECLLYEIQMEYPSLNLHTALELVTDEKDVHPVTLISRAGWDIPKSWLNKRTEEFFNMIHRWYQVYNDYPRVRRKIDSMRQTLITLCSFTNPVPSQSIADLNDSAWEFQGISLFLNQVLDLRKNN